VSLPSFSFSAAALDGVYYALRFDVRPTLFFRERESAIGTVPCKGFLDKKLKTNCRATRVAKPHRVKIERTNQQEQRNKKQ
jgi:hypothetical protein